MFVFFTVCEYPYCASIVTGMQDGQKFLNLRSNNQSNKQTKQYPSLTYNLLCPSNSPLSFATHFTYSRLPNKQQCKFIKF